MKIGIIGLGLIGGSMAKCIKSYTPQHTVLGHDINEETMKKALMSGAIKERLDKSRLKECDLIMIALCPADLIAYVKDVAPCIGKGSVLVDLCGVKREICSAISPIAKEYGFCFVGGHPMAGTESSGFDSASDALFSGASMILVPDDCTDIRTLEMLKAFFLSISFGSIAFSVPDEHDRIIAYTSQLAHVVSSAYVRSPSALSHVGFSAGSFRDMTRVAKLDESMWTELFMNNADFLGAELDAFIENLRLYAKAIKNRDSESLRELLKEGRERKAVTG